MKKIKDSELKTRIFESLDNAIENGYDFLDDDVEDIAEDLGKYDAELDGIDPVGLMPYIKEWLLTKGR